MIYSVQDRMEDKLIRLGWLKIDKWEKVQNDRRKERQLAMIER